MVQPRRPQVTRGLPMQQRPSAMMQAPAQPAVPARMASFSQRYAAPQAQPVQSNRTPLRSPVSSPRVSQPQAMAAVPSQVRQQTQAPQISSYVQQQAQPRQQMQRIQQNQMSAYGQPQPYMDTRGGIPPAWLRGQSEGQPQPQPTPQRTSGGFVSPPRTDLRPSTNPDGSPIGTGNGMPYEPQPTPPRTGGVTPMPYEPGEVDMPIRHTGIGFGQDSALARDNMPIRHTGIGFGQDSALARDNPQFGMPPPMPYEPQPTPPRTGGVTPMPYEPPMQPGGMGGEEFFRELRRKSSNSQPTPPRTGGVTPMPQQAQEYNDIYQSQNSGINGTFDPNKVERERQAREKYGPQPGGGNGTGGFRPDVWSTGEVPIRNDRGPAYVPGEVPIRNDRGPAYVPGEGGVTAPTSQVNVQQQMEEARRINLERALQAGGGTPPAPNRQNADGSFMGPIGGASFTTKTGFNPENKVAGVATPKFYKKGGKVAPKPMAKPASRASAKPAVKGYAKGGTVMASSRGDGIAQRGKTKGRIR